MRGFRFILVMTGSFLFMGQNFSANELGVTCTTTDVTCNGANDGSATAIVSGGILPYTFLWSNDENTSSITGLAPGTYSVLVTDAEGSTVGATCMVENQNALQVSCTSTPVSCPEVPTNCTETALVLWDFTNCGASYSDYSEFIPSYPGEADCGNPNASIVSRESGTHSCNEGREGGDGIGFCVGDFDAPDYIADSFHAIRFSLGFGIGDHGHLSGLSFWELADDTLQFLNNTTTIYNNYPTKYAVRVLKNGNEIFLQTDIETSTIYSLEQFDFSDLESFEYIGPTVFDFELFAYAPVGNGELNYIWDLDDISIDGCCGSSPSPEAMESNCDGIISCNATGGSGQYSYSWTYNEDFNTGSYVPLLFDGPELDSLCAGTYCVIVTDLVSGCLECVCIMVEEQVCAPMLFDDLVTVGSGNDINIDVLANDLLPNDIIDSTFQILSGPNSGTASITNGTITYISDPDFTGNDQFTYVICNPFFCDSASVTITVTENGNNSAPVANDDIVVINPNESIVIDVQANDYDPDGDPLVTSILGGPLNGTVTVLNGDSINYMPNAGFEGNEILTYVVSDGNGNADSATITIEVTSGTNGNESPVANDDNVSTNVNASITADVQANDFDPDGDPLTTFLTSQPLNGTATVLNGASILYIPNPDFEGTDTFTYTISDGNGGTDTATVTITVSATSNICPIVLSDFVITDENVAVTFDPLSNDADPDGELDLTSVTLLSGPVNGTATVDPITGIVTYTPGTNFSDNDLIVYEVCDLDVPACCDIGFIFITVNPNSSNNCPIVLDENFTTDENVSITFDPLSNDSDSDDGIDPTSVSLISGPVNGVANVDPLTGAIAYTPNQNFIGNDLLGYSVCDLNDPPCCEIGFVTLTILPDSINNCISALDDEISTEENLPITFNPLDNDSDLDDGVDPTSVSILSGTLNGTLDLDPNNGSMTYTPNTNFIGIENLIYAVCDLNVPACCDTALITITVLPDSINNCPVLMDDSVSVDENMTLVFNPLDNDTDSDNGIDPTSLILLSGPVNGTATIDPLTGEITYSPEENFIDEDHIAYEACDLNDPPCCQIAFIFVDILPDTINNCPVAVNDTITLNQDSQITFDPLVNDTDSDNGLDPTSVSILSGPLNGMANVNTATGEMTYVPNPGFAGSDLISYSVCDLAEPTCCDFAFIHITVNGCVNTPLSAIEDLVTVDEDSSVIIPVLDNDIDLDGDMDASSLAVITSPLHGNVQVDPNTGTLIYQPDQNFFGLDSLVYLVNDTSCSAVNEASAKVLITIQPVNDCPVALNDTTLTEQAVAVRINVHNNDSDIDGMVDSTSVFIISGLANGTANVDPFTGEINYVPFSEFIGTDTINYVICDDGSPSCCDTATVYIDVISIADAICIPKAFSPNGDQNCDLFVISPNPKIYPQNELKVFNRWGNCVYEMRGYNNTWDGTSNTGGALYGDEIHDGTYFYVFDLGNGDQPLNGSVVIKRK